jgi:hypothetical protein
VQAPAPADPRVAAFSAAEPRLLQIRTLVARAGKQSSIGSGFLVSADGLAFTNYHVVSQTALEPAPGGSNTPPPMVAAASSSCWSSICRTISPSSASTSAIRRSLPWTRRDDDRDEDRQARIVIDGERPIRIGHTYLRIRKTNHAVPRERAGRLEGRAGRARHRDPRHSSALGVVRRDRRAPGLALRPAAARDRRRGRGLGERSGPSCRASFPVRPGCSASSSPRKGWRKPSCGPNSASRVICAASCRRRSASRRCRTRTPSSPKSSSSRPSSIGTEPTIQARIPAAEAAKSGAGPQPVLGKYR